jgi:hypothetical protein
MVEKEIFHANISPANIKEIFLGLSNIKVSFFENKNRVLNSTIKDFYNNYK